MSYFHHLKAVMVTLVRNAMAKNIEYLIDKGTRPKKSVENSTLGGGGPARVIFPQFFSKKKIKNMFDC